MAQLLIIEDSAAIRHMVRDRLLQAGLIDSILEATSGADGLKQVQMHAPDLVLLCLVLPDGDGLTILRTIRAIPMFHDLPVIILTAKSDVATKIRLLENGASDYLVKPFDHGELLARIKVQLKVKQLQDSLKHTSTTDYLTGLFNRRHFMESFRREYMRSKRYQQPLGYIIADLDHFKSINDTYGHDAGDKTLKALARTLQQGVRSHDMVGRYGGEEFAIFLPMANALDTIAIAQRLRYAVSKLSFPFMPERKITVSLGTCAHTAAYQPSVDEMMNGADKALYAAKHNGRNCVAQYLHEEIQLDNS